MNASAAIVDLRLRQAGGLRARRARDHSHVAESANETSQFFWRDLYLLRLAESQSTC